MKYFIIPGNPPALHFYELWQKEIETQVPGAMTFSSDYPILEKTADSHYFMQQVFQHHQNNFERFLEKSHGPIILLGHSLGSYFCLKLMDQFHEKIKKTVLIHPFLRRPTKRGRWILQTVSSLNHLHPVKNIIIKNKNKLEVIASELRHISEEELIKTFPIATHELKVVGQDQSSLQVPEIYQKKVTIYHTDGDTWCSPQVVQELKAQVETHLCDEPHDFIINQSHRLSLLEKILKLRE
jgi:predicted alpha/beta hydrolase family esterase